MPYVWEGSRTKPRPPEVSLRGWLSFSEGGWWSACVNDQSTLGDTLRRVDAETSKQVIGADWSAVTPGSLTSVLWVGVRETILSAPGAVPLLYSVQVFVSVICCCVTNHPKTRCLKSAKPPLSHTPRCPGLWPGLWPGLGRVALTWATSRSCGPMSAGTAVSLKAGLGREAPHTAGADCCLGLYSSPHACLSVFTAWQLASPRAADPIDQGAAARGRHTLSLPPCYTDHAGPALVQRGRGVHKGLNAVRWGSLLPSWGLAPESVLVPK